MKVNIATEQPGRRMVVGAMDTREASFLDQNVRFHAAGGDLNALVRVIYDESSGVRIGDGSLTRLYYAASRNWCSSIACLLEHGADVHCTSDGKTPLHIAAFCGQCDAAVLLLDAGARVDDRTRIGSTALHLAAAHHRSKLCKLLLSRGASLDARDNGGRDPEAYARHYHRTTTADLLAAVRAAGGWLPWLNAPRKELLALRQRLPALRERGRAAPSSSVRAHERLFLETPDDVFLHALTFWRSDRDD